MITLTPDPHYRRILVTHRDVRDGHGHGTLTSWARGTWSATWWWSRGVTVLVTGVTKREAVAAVRLYANACGAGRAGT